MRIARLIASIALGLIAVIGTVRATNAWPSSAGIDFYQFWVGGQVAGRVDNFYSLNTRVRIGDEYVRRAAQEASARYKLVAEYRRDMEWYSSPLQYAFFSMFGDRYDDALSLFQFLSLAGFIAAFAIIAWVLRLTLLRALMLYDIVILFFEPLRSDVRVVSVNALVLFALALALWATARRRFALAGAILALTVLFKPYIAMVFPVVYALLIVERRWRDLRAHVIGAIAGGAIGFVIAALRFRSLTIWLDWVRALRAIPESSVTAELGNYALSPLLSIPSVILTLVFFAIAVAMFAWRKQGNDLAAIALGVVITFLGAPLVWPHYLLLAIPLIAYLVRSDERLPLIAGIVALLMLAVIVPGARTEAAVVNAGLLIACAAALTWRTEPPAPLAVSEKGSRGLPRTSRSSRSRASRKA